MSTSSGHATLPVPDTEDRDRFSISDLSGEFGVSARALRFYEDEGLITPERVGLARIYSRRDRARLAWILRGKRVGFSLADIREMIDLYDVGDQRRTQRHVTIERCRARMALLDRQRTDIDATLVELGGFVEWLEQRERQAGRTARITAEDD